MLTDDMKSLLRYIIFDLKINHKCVENPYRKSFQFFLLLGALFDTILRPKSPFKIISKSSKLVLSTSKPHLAPPEVSRKAPGALKAAPR